MELARTNGPSRPRENVRVQAGPATNDNGNVEKIRLRTDVDMHFWVDASSGFLGGIPNEKNNGPLRVDQQKPAEKAHVHIKTGGPFVYDLKNETAYFEAHRCAKAPPTRRTPSRSRRSGPRRAFTEGRGERQVRPAHLRSARPAIPQTIERPRRQREGGDKEIETAKATRRDKNEVVLSLDSEQMAAYGTDLFYRAGDLTNGR